MPLPSARPEDRRRADIDAAQPCYRSEAFAEDLADAPDLAATSPAPAPRWRLFTRRLAAAGPAGLPLPRLRGA